MSLKDKILFITGASRGIGREIAVRAAAQGAKVAIFSKTAAPHPKLPGTIYTVEREIREAGGQALAIQGDVRDEADVKRAIGQCVETFGGLDVLINNAAAISLTPTLDTPMARYDLLHDINARGVYLCAQKALPHLLNSANAHILTIAPPLDLDPKWFGPHLAHSLSKYAASLCTLGLAEEFKDHGVAVNALWPLTAIATRAYDNHDAGSQGAARTPAIMADAALSMISKPARDYTGYFKTDEQALRDDGVTDFSAYATHPGAPLICDLYISDALKAETDTVFHTP